MPTYQLLRLSKTFFRISIRWSFDHKFLREKIFFYVFDGVLSLSFNILSSCIFLPTVCAHFQKSPGFRKWILDWKHQNVSVVACMKGKSNFSVVQKTLYQGVYVWHCLCLPQVIRDQGWMALGLIFKPPVSTCLQSTSWKWILGRKIHEKTVL